jgi:CspA family cold shock protein
VTVEAKSGTTIERPSAARSPKETRMAGGTIKRLVRDRGFGFIRDDRGQEWFFHRSSVQGSFDQLNEGQRVSFDEEPSAKGPRAGNVRTEG